MSPAEMEIVPDDNAGQAERPLQEVEHEGTGARGSQSPVEAAHDQAVEAQMREHDLLGGEAGQPEHRRIGREIGPRMRLEGQDHGRSAGRTGLGAHALDEHPMTEMDAIEIADRRHGPGQGGWDGRIGAADREGPRGRVVAWGHRFGVECSEGSDGIA